MRAYNRLKLLFGSMGFIFVIGYIFHQSTMVQERERILNLKALRKQLISEMCDSDNDPFSDVVHTFEEIRDSNLRHLIVDDNQGIIYCYIPLVTTLDWIVFPNHRHTSLSMIMTQEKLKEYTKFLFVQHPFVRLISAYREAFLHEEQDYHRRFGLQILYEYTNISDPPLTVEEAFAAGVRPSFYNFIEYLTDPETTMPFEPIWRPMYQLCHPCVIEYDFVGHLETFQEDTQLLLHILQQDSRFYHGETPSDSVAEWFREVPAEMGRKLYKLYEMDFKLFGYPEPVEWLDG